jgi:hypothetical protein
MENLRADRTRKTNSIFAPWKVTILFGAGVMTVALAVAIAVFAYRPSAEMGLAGSITSRRLARTLSIVGNGTSEHPQVLRILFYGQSITSNNWIEPAVAQLRRIYPHIRFDVHNMAIGGFDSSLLEHTAKRDLAEFYPDLIVFHAYGDHRAYERIVRMIRSRTAADVILQTDHITTPIEPICLEGFRFTLTVPPGCKGFLWYKQRSWEEFMSGTLIPRLANQYGLAVEPRREYWNDYLKLHNLQPPALLQDEVHPNAEGWRLMADIFARYFETTVANYGGQVSEAVANLSIPKLAGTTSYRFDGNRVEVLARGPLDGKITASIDGRVATDVDGCWLESRTTRLPNVPDWPAIRRVIVGPHIKRSETWTLRVTELSGNQDDFRFTLTSDKGGPDGEGRGSVDFVSPSGRVRIGAKDWVIHDGYKLAKKGVPEGYEVQWSRNFICHDESAVATSGNELEVRHVLATGLDNGSHQISIQLEPEALALIEEIRVYRPPLRD